MMSNFHKLKLYSKYKFLRSLVYIRRWYLNFKESTGPIRSNMDRDTDWMMYYKF